MEPFVVHQWLHQPEPKSRADRLAESYEVRRRRPTGRMLKRVTDAQPHLQERQLRLLEQLEWILFFRIVHGLVTLAPAGAAMGRQLL